MFLPASATTEFLQNFTCGMLPGSFWRVQHGQSQAAFDKDHNLVAKWSDYAPRDPEDFRDILQSHLRWGHTRRNSCFLSMFDNYHHAVAWGKSRYRWQSTGTADVDLYEVDTSLLQDVMIFKLDDLLLNLNMGPLKWETSHEYLILNHIPQCAIQRLTDIETIILDGKFVLRRQ